MTTTLAAAGDGAPLSVWSNLLRCVGEDGIGERELAPAARISTRAATTLVTAADRRGLVETAKAATGKARTVRIRDAGRECRASWEERLAVFDRERGRDVLREALEELVARLELEHAWYPMSYGSADPSAAGGPYVNATGRTGDPAHGTDWKPVVRGDGDTVSDVPTTALLSQALMAYTVDYENRFPWPLANTMNVLVHVRAEARPLAELPDGHGITGVGKSLLERHGIVKATKKDAQLTARGVQVLEHHPKRLDAVDSLWRERFGDDLLGRVRTELAAAPGVDDASLPDHAMTAP